MADDPVRSPRAAPFRAAILDLDGVLTRTARVHARAWKAAFDDLLSRRAEAAGEPFVPFDAEGEYRRLVDGKPRLDGVRAFLAARGIELPEGGPDDAADADTVHALGARKNALFRALLAEGGVQVYDDAVEQVRRWRAAGMPVAIVTSSRNGAAVLEAAGLTALFDVRVDGEDAARLGLRGKPAPDTFLHAARDLGVDPADAILVEDAEAGVRAGRAGGFGLVVGVDRGAGAELGGHGADRVVRDLRELDGVVRGSSS